MYNNEMIHLSLSQWFDLSFDAALAGYLLCAFLPVRTKGVLLPVAILIHALSVGIRAVSAGRMPLAGVFDTLSFFALSTAGCGALFYKRFRRTVFLEC